LQLLAVLPTLHLLQKKKKRKKTTAAALKA
jgi:hypothetical protein